MASFHPFLWLSNIPLYICTTSSYPFICQGTLRLLSPLGNCKYHCWWIYQHWGACIFLNWCSIFFFFFWLYTCRRALWAATVYHTGPNCAQMTKSSSLEQVVSVFILPRPNLGLLGNYLFLCNWKHLSKVYIKKKQRKSSKNWISKSFSLKTHLLSSNKYPVELINQMSIYKLQYKLS